jgi:hypothetical protein
MKTFNQFITESTLEQFDALWKKRPVYGSGEWKAGMGNTAIIRKFNTALMLYYIKHFGGKDVWTPKLQRKYLTAMWEGKTITFKKERFPMANGLDEKDYVVAILLDKGIISK